MRKALVALVVVFVCAAHAAMAADDGQTQPKLNTASSNSSSTPTDLIPFTNSSSGNIKGVTCILNHDGSGNQPSAVVKFYVNGGGAQTVVLSGFQATTGGAGYTGWVPYNVRFSSIQVTIQKQSSIGNAVDCAVSWGFD